MFGIDWKSRVSNKSFWIALIPALLILAQFVLKVLGVEVDVSAMEGDAIDLVNAVFSVLAIFGIVVDTSTEGILDESCRAKREGGLK